MSRFGRDSRVLLRAKEASEGLGTGCGPLPGGLANSGTWPLQCQAAECRPASSTTVCSSKPVASCQDARLARFVDSSKDARLTGALLILVLDR
jgi:hypothetical protein